MLRLARAWQSCGERVRLRLTRYSLQDSARGVSDRAAIGVGGCIGRPGDESASSLLVIGMSLAPLPAVVADHLSIHGVRLNFAAVVVSPAPTLAIGTTTNELVGTKTGRLKWLQAVTAGAIAHRTAPDQDASRSL